MRFYILGAFMGKFLAIIFLCASVVVSLMGQVVSADDTGLASALHQLKTEKRKLCMVGHFHTGTSESQKTRRLAMKIAIRNWEDFTSWEYGTDWGRFKQAENKGRLCNKMAKSWECSVQARPCKRRRK